MFFTEQNHYITSQNSYYYEPKFDMKYREIPSFRINVLIFIYIYYKIVRQSWYDVSLLCWGRYFEACIFYWLGAHLQPTDGEWGHEGIIGKPESHSGQVLATLPHGGRLSLFPTRRSSSHDTKSF